ncbi:MAG: DUF7017 domain-containing protein [Candidatus Brachytrichaceae bacterium NZ_4S206]|jgi:tetratricopeptide (TPR) repeat protein
MIGTTLYDEAESLRKTGKLSEAEAKFAQLWNQQPTQMVGWRYVYCLRKQGKLREAERVARDATAKFPGDKYTLSELVWVLYEAYLKPAVDKDNLASALPALRELAQLPLEGLALTRVALVAIKLAKSEKRWDLVLEWADKLQPHELAAEPITLPDGKKGMSDRETWYINRSQALYELRRFAEARQQAQIGLREFPNDLWLGRCAARAAAAQGDVNQALAEYRLLVNHPRSDWYVKAELAELEYQAGNLEEAYRLLCESLQKLQDQRFKLPYLVTMAQVALDMGKYEVAAEHMALAQAIRRENAWKVPKEQVRVERALRAAYPESSQLPSDLSKLTQMCQKRWREGSSLGLRRVRGYVKDIIPDRYYTFITQENGGEDVFVHMRDLPEEARQKGVYVEYELKKSFDKKKNRESFVATHVVVISSKSQNKK